MTFDPFGDFATEGYLRNFEKEKDLAIVKRAENASFTTGLDEAFASLAEVKALAYADVLKTHGILFGAIYPWAGQDRTQTAPRLTIKKGRSFSQTRRRFAPPSSSRCVKGKTRIT